MLCVFTASCGLSVEVFSVAVDVTPEPVFFFQAEDGIRDHCVTGVQTCALPISFGRGPHRRGCDARCWGSRRRRRSEERRVGKECRYRWTPDEEKISEEGGRQDGSVGEAYGPGGPKRT